ncbi:MAG: GspE/PulE family protein [bacterium]|nr:MAG: GspE/PulE family protein [bacterium]
MPNTATANVNKTATGNNLADILVSMGVLDKTRADQVKMAEVQYGTTQEEIIKKQNLVNNTDLVKAKATFYNVPFVDLATSPSSPEAMSILSQEVSNKFNIFPLAVDKTAKNITLAMADPLDLTAIEFVERKTGLRVKPVAVEEDKLEDIITTRYASSLSQEVTEALKDVAPDKKVSTSENLKIGFIREEKISEIVTHILEFAVKSRSSDIHIEPEERATRVRYRVDGILVEKLTIPRELHESLTSRIKILSGMKIDEKRIPQDGRFNFKAANEDTDLRVSSLPTAWGEKIVMRLLKKTGGVPDLPTLGLRGKALKNLQDAILRPHGIILICGPTGSGKTTTLYSIISKINTPKVNIVTLEDPIEYKMVGVNQVQINPAVGLTFASGLKAFLRQDPNVILVGEIRDQETADLAIQASLTGHLVFSTLHTNNAAGALPRMLDMGAEPYLLTSSMTAIMAQRVARKIHEDCKEEFTPDPKIVEDMKTVLGPLWPTNSVGKTYRGKGCQACGNTGYYGRVGIFEVLPVSDSIGKMILGRSPAVEIEKKAKEEGMITLKQDGYLKVLAGETTIEEVLRVAQE